MILDTEVWTLAKIIPILSNLIPENERSKLSYYSKEDQLQLLELVKAADENAGNEEPLYVSEDDINVVFQKMKGSKVPGSYSSVGSVSSDNSKINKLRRDILRSKEKSRSSLSKFLKP